MKPMLDDPVMKWLKAHRDADGDPTWRSMIDDLLDDYREHARLGVDLDVDITRQ